MSKDEALQMCLEYIETDAHERKYVRHAIKQALAAPVQEPVATLFGSLPVYDTPPVKEPVAWLVYAKGSRKYFTLTFDPNKVPEIYIGGEAVPLYTTLPAAQRTWVGLTDDEILKLAYPIRWQEVDDFEADKAVNFAQAIEAKLKEKNT
jgi:hypothetical protein